MLARARAAGVAEVLVPGVDPEQWRRAEGLPRTGRVVLRFAAGLHPWALARLDDEDVAAALDGLPDALAALGACALGEVGWDRPLARREASSSMARQDRAAERQLALARDLGLPPILHVVGAHGRALERLGRFGRWPRGGVVHAYSGPPDLVAAYVDLGLSLSFGPAVTRPNARRPRAAAAACPPEHLLAETDGPDQAVEDGPGEPREVRAVLEALAEARGEPFAAVAAHTDRNATKLFGGSGAPRPPRLV